MLKHMLFALLACVLLAAPAEALAVRTGIVDVEKVLSDSAAAKAANEHLAKVQAVLQKGFNDLEKRMEKAKKEERDRELEAGRRVLERQMQIELQAARAVVSQHMLEAVKEWRKSKGGVVLAKSQVLDYSPKFDITELVITNMDKTPVTFNALPVVSFKDKEANKEKNDKK